MQTQQFSVLPYPPDPHVVEVVKKSYQIVVVAGKLLRGCHFESHPVRHAGVFSLLAGRLDGFFVIVKTDKLGCLLDIATDDIDSE